MNIYFRNIYREWLRKLPGEESYITIDILITNLCMNNVLTVGEYNKIKNEIRYADKLQVDLYVDFI